MECPADTTIVELLEGTLDPGAVDAVERHVDGCAPCRRLLAEMARSGGNAATAEAAAVEPPRAVPLYRGVTVDRYVVLDVLGAGGMGVVYAAYDPELDRRVALKLLRGDLGPARAEVRARLVREARAMALLSHPNVITVYDAGSFGDEVFIAMELVPGGTLAAHLAAEARSVREILDVFARAGAGLAAAHGAKVVHRDFKPENVMIGPDGRALVTDFGLALSAEDGIAERAVAGTPAYMAPEQLREGRAEPRSDQFAFAVALFEALYGRRPFTGATRAELLAAAVRDQPVRPPALAARGGRVPSRARRALARALAADPEHRYPSMAALLGELAPRARGARGVALAALLVAVLTATALGVLRARRSAAETACRGAERELAGVWDEARKAEVERAFRALPEAPYAEASLRSVRRILDAYADRWTRTHVDVCEATGVHGEQSEALFAERMACLLERRRELGALVEELATPTRRTVELSVQAAGALSDVAQCSASRLAVAARTRPHDPELAVRAEALRGVLADARSRVNVGDVHPARRAIEDALPAVRAVGDARLAATAQLLLARVQGYLGEFPREEESLLEAVWDGESAGDDEIVARAWLRLVYVRGIELTNQAEAARAERHARATVERLGSPGELAAELSLMRSRLAGRVADYDQALELARAALALYEAQGTGDSLEATGCLSTIAFALNALGRAEEGRAAILSAIAIRERILGTAHPEVLQSLGRLGTTEMELGRYDEARRTLERALAGFEATTGPESTEAGMVHENLGIAVVSLGDRPAARGHFERALAILQKTLGDHPSTANATMNLADFDREAGHFAEAIAGFTRAEEILGRTKSPEPRVLGLILTGRGRAELDAGRPAEAVRVLDRALPLLEHRGPLPGAEAALALAQALARLRRDPARVRALATTAREVFARNLPAREADRAAAEALVASSVTR
jgi:tetratricopeptide (TPR) repeat protein